MMLSGWGNFPKINAKICSPRDLESLIVQIKKGHAIARGNGRSYGDSSINVQNTINMKHFKRMLFFDKNHGKLISESGVFLSDIVKVFLPQGWFPAVTPGSKFVTLGGMIAADVHGKNHHKEGSFGKFVEWIELIDKNGKIIRCSKEKNKKIFEMTIGGMGLTGIILKASIKLKSIETGWIKQKIFRTKNLDETINIFEKTMNSNYSVAWVDCLQSQKNLGRSLIILGEHANLKDLKKFKVKRKFPTAEEKIIFLPFYFHPKVLNKFTVKIFNFFYYYFHYFKRNETLISWDKFFYPLDKIIGWNKIYGRKGFIQYQCVLPLEKSKEGMKELLFNISKTGHCSFLTVLKRFGPQDSLFSFPMEGYTLALDFPVNSKTLKLMERLDEITLKYDGRFYLAKDSRLKSETLYKSDRRVYDFVHKRKKEKLLKSFNSSQSNRLKI